MESSCNKRRTASEQAKGGNKDFPLLHCHTTLNALNATLGDFVPWSYCQPMVNLLSLQQTRVKPLWIKGNVVIGNTLHLLELSLVQLMLNTRLNRMLQQAKQLFVVVFSISCTSQSPSICIVFPVTTFALIHRGFTLVWSTSYPKSS